MTEIKIFSIILNKAKNKTKIENLGHFNVLITSTYFWKLISLFFDTQNFYCGLAICFIIGEIKLMSDKVSVKFSWYSL